MMKKLMFLVLVIAVLAGSAMAAPDGPYRLVFITSTNIGILPEWDTPTSLDGIDAHVQSLATAAGLPGTGWKVLGSTSYVDARDHTGTNPLTDGAGVPIYLVDGTTLVATGNADLWDAQGDFTVSPFVYTEGLQNVIGKDEYGNAKTHWPLTGTYFDGTVSDPSKAPTSGLGLDSTGNIAQANGGDVSQWVFRGWTQRPAQGSNSMLPVYAISEVIPEPATMALLGLGGLTLLRRRRNG